VVVTNPPPLLSIIPTNIDFPPAIVGQTNTMSFQVINLGGLTLTGSVALPQPFSAAGGNPFNVPPGQTSLVLLAFSPTNAASFANSAVFSSNGGTSTNPVTGTGLAPALFGVTPTNFDFGTLTVGASNDVTFVLTNFGDVPITNGLATLDPGPYQIISGSPFSLDAFGVSNITVRFSPSAAGTFNNRLVITTDNGGNSIQLLTGVGALVPAATFSGNPTTGIAPLTVAFTDSSTGTITNRFWDFGDGVTSNTSLASLIHTYMTTGTNTVSL